MPSHRSILVRILAFLPAAVSCCGLAASSPDTGTITYRVDTPSFELQQRSDGQRIRVDGFGIIGESAKPMLPAKIFAVGFTRDTVF